MKKSLIILLISLISLVFAGNIEPNGINQGDLYKLLDNLVYSRMYMPLTDAGVTASATANATFSMPTTINYVAGGYLYTALPSTNILAYTKSSASAIKRTLAKTPVSIFVLNINSAGAYYISSSYGNYLPSRVNGYTPLGGAKVTLTAGNTAGFTLGTTKWNAATQNVEYFDLSGYATGASKVSLTDL